MDRRQSPILSKSAPVRAGEQKPGNHLVFNGENRRDRRAKAVRVAKARQNFPPTVWLIAGIVHGMQLHTKTPIYQLTIERPDRRDTLTIYSREGAAPVVGGLLERNPMPNGGEAAMWTGPKLDKAGIGGGYTGLAVPAAWGFPEPEQAPEEPRSFQNLNLGEPWQDLRDASSTDR